MLRCAGFRKWLEAFYIVLAGPASRVGAGYRWKNGLLILALVFTVSTPFFSFTNSRAYQGAMPPDTPLIKAFGNVVFRDETRGVKSVSVAEFMVNAGKTLTLEGDYAGLPEIRDWQAKRPGETIYVEGFELLDGRGLFWISYAAARDGTVLMQRDHQAKAIKNLRNPFNASAFWMLVIVTGPMWVACFINVSKVRITLGN